MAVRVKVAEGSKSEGKRLPGEEVLWLACEWRSTGEKKYYLCNHAPNTTLKTLARHIKARWSCEQAHEQLKNQVGLDHLECRSWRALHHHALLSMIAFCFLQDLRTRRGDKRGTRRRRLPRQGPPPSPSLPEIRRRILQILVRECLPRCPTCGRANTPRQRA